jgi:RNA polymerase sigma-70 factor (ECF subfamily)
MDAGDEHIMGPTIAQVEVIAHRAEGDRPSHAPSQEPTWPMSGYACWSDHDLMAAVRDGDDGAFDELVRRYQSPMTGYLYRLLNDYETALDLAQETFVRLYRNAHRYRANHNFSTYLYKIATNLAISELRRRKRWNMLSLVSFFAARDGEGDERPFDLPDPRPLPDAQILHEEQRRIIARAVASLPEKYRAAIILRDIQGLEYEQIAEVLGLPLGTVKSRINRARNFLREKLRGYLSE